MSHILEIPLTPYFGTLFATTDENAYSRMARSKLGVKHAIDPAVVGGDFMSGGHIKTSALVQLMWVRPGPLRVSVEFITHESAHAVFDIFERIKAHPAECNNEPFNYMQGYIVRRISSWWTEPKPQLTQPT